MAGVEKGRRADNPDRRAEGGGKGQRHQQLRRRDPALAGEVERRLREYGERTAGVAAAVTSAAQDMASTVAETAGTAAAKAQEMARAAATAVTDTLAGAGT
jgi:hypothetical protein